MPLILTMQVVCYYLKNHWLTNNSSINRDLVHLLTKRSNTGTGGIAYVDALCSNNWGYAFSSDLDNTTSFSFPSPPYTWNLNVVTHEIGHNIGANHTHWCGWLPDSALGFAGGGIDDCGVISGSSSACNPPAPHPSLGTIMSYCHVGGGGIQINFHEIIKNKHYFLEKMEHHVLEFALITDVLILQL